MRIARLFRHGLPWMAVAGACLPAQVSMADQSGRRPAAPQTTVFAVSDVALAQGGLLKGQLLNEQMQPVAGTEVTIVANGRTVAATTTDANGVFAVAGLRGGFHQITTAVAIENCRFWIAGTEPPRATQGIQIIASRDVVRGQWGPRQWSTIS